MLDGVLAITFHSICYAVRSDYVDYHLNEDSFKCKKSSHVKPESVERNLTCGRGCLAAGTVGSLPQWWAACSLIALWMGKCHKAVLPS